MSFEKERQTYCEVGSTEPSSTNHGSSKPPTPPTKPSIANVTTNPALLSVRKLSVYEEFSYLTCLSSRIIVDFPHPDGPTITTPIRCCNCSYNSTHFCS